MRAAIYHRPERTASEEETGKQLHDLEEWCGRRGFEISQKYVEKASGDGRQRPVFVQMMKDATKGKFDVLAVWSFKNFRRFAGVKDVKYISHLKELGVRFVSYQEPFFDTTSNYSELLVPMFNWIATEEAKTISERTKTGLEKARREGSIIGRPKTQLDEQKIVELRKQGKSLRELSETFGTSKETIRRILIASKTGPDSDKGVEE